MIKLKDIITEKKSCKGIEEKTNKTDIKSEIIKFFKKHPYPDDSKIHKLADKLKLNPHELETNIYSVLSDLLKNN